WRPNLFFLILAVAAVGGYLYGVRRLARRGDAWPIGRTIAWCLGWVIAVVITSSGFGKYSAPDFATHMIVHMTLNMLVPVFLALRAARPKREELAGLHTWITWLLNWRVLRWVYNPLFVFAFFIISYYGLYLSAMFGKLMPFHWGHQLMNTHFLIVGVMFYSLVIGVDPTPRQLPHIGKLGYIVAAMPFHAFFGIVLMTSRHIIVEDFYGRLPSPRQAWGGPCDRPVLRRRGHLGRGRAPPARRRHRPGDPRGETGRPRSPPQGPPLRHRPRPRVRRLQRDARKTRRPRSE